MFAVGYSGYATDAALAKRLDNTEEGKRPDCALVAGDPGVLVYKNIGATGADALMLFVGLLMNHCAELISAPFKVILPSKSSAKPTRI